GTKRWRKFDAWPPKDVSKSRLYLHSWGKLAFDPPGKGKAYEEYISDPHKPVPFTEAYSLGMTREYMTDDQRFASKRPDVAVFQTDVLQGDLTLAGKIVADLKVSTSSTDSDFVVKIIDVFPNNAPGVGAGVNPPPM